ncbi:MAG: RNA polymerase sigma factor [Dehalococcoidia bacterium]
MGEDEDLAEGIRRREPRAMELLYDRHCRQAFGLAYRILGDGPSAEDAVQEAFLTVWRQAHRLEPARGVVSFLMTVVHHKAIDLLRTRRGQTARYLPLNPAAIEQQGADVLETVADSLRRDAVKEALRSLPQEQRQPIELAYFGGLTHVEIAEALGVPLGTVKSRLRLGLEKMRSALGIESI